MAEHEPRHLRFTTPPGTRQTNEDETREARPLKYAALDERLVRVYFPRAGRDDTEQDDENVMSTTGAPDEIPSGSETPEDESTEMQEEHSKEEKTPIRPMPAVRDILSDPPLFDTEAGQASDLEPPGAPIDDRPVPTQEGPDEPDTGWAEVEVPPPPQRLVGPGTRPLDPSELRPPEEPRRLSPAPDHLDLETREARRPKADETQSGHPTRAIEDEVVIQRGLDRSATPMQPGRAKPARQRSAATVISVALVLLIIAGAIFAGILLIERQTGLFSALLQAPEGTAAPVKQPTDSAPTTAAEPAEPITRPTSAPPTPEVVESEEPTSPAPSQGPFVLGGVEMVAVPGGTFPMGVDGRGDNSPIHEVSLSPFYIDRTEITNAQWQTCVDEGACDPPGLSTAYDGTPYYGNPVYDNYPVIYVSWEQARDYCAWRGARLPSEAEWEMAARWDPVRGRATLYPWGDEWEPTRANYCDADCALRDFADRNNKDGFAQTAPVGSFPDGASPYGVLDMAGNVAEWVNDFYSATYYSISPTENPPGPEAGILHVVRGGAWGVGQDGLLSVLRSRFEPGAQGPGIGVRCAANDGEVNR